MVTTMTKPMADSADSVKSRRVNAPALKRPTNTTIKAFDNFVSLVEKYSKPKASSYNWKTDYTQALEDKYAGIR